MEHRGACGQCRRSRKGHGHHAPELLQGIISGRFVRVCNVRTVPERRRSVSSCASGRRRARQRAPALAGRFPRRSRERLSSGTTTRCTAPRPGSASAAVLRGMDSGASPRAAGPRYFPGHGAENHRPGGPVIASRVFCHRSVRVCTGWPVTAAIKSKFLSMASTVSPAFSAHAAISRSGMDGARC